MINKRCNLDTKTGWEFARLFTERIARFLPKNEQMSDSLNKTSDLFTSLIFGEQPEQFAHIAHQKRGNELIAHFLNIKKTYIKHTKKSDFRFF